MKLFSLLMAVCMLVSSLAFASGGGGSSGGGGGGRSDTPRDLELEKAQVAITLKDWAAALAVLEPYTVANPRNADGFNLLGYSLRNQKKYDESLVAYKQALTLNPKHKGAHEYIGEAYIQMGQLDKAKEHLAILDKLCFFSCEEFRDLKKAIAQAQ